MIKDPQYYWNNKLIAYLHDPIDKVFAIKGHEERGALLLDALSVQKPNRENFADDFKKQADVISAGIERGQMPSYSKNDSENGAINFHETPVLTHPVSDKQLKIQLPERYKIVDPSTGYNELSNEVIKHINTVLELYRKKSGLFRERSTEQGANEFAQARFLYTHLVLRFGLAEKNVGELGALWHRLPADSRFPDHSIWQHNALTSALYSCMEEGGGSGNTGLMVFSITPVQPFIAKARKLRDYWTGSVLLSWLAFEGIRWIMENLGPDHVVYPSLIDQPLINEYLKKEWDMESILSNGLNKKNDIASFPNKFLYLVPLNRAEEIGEAIKKHIQLAWEDLTTRVETFLVKKLNLSEDRSRWVEEIFKRQTGSYWDFNYAAVKLVGSEDKSELEKLLNSNSFNRQTAFIDIFKNLHKKHWKTDFEGLFYSVSHSLAQRSLASLKGQRINSRLPEPGEKCPQCGEFEVLHDFLDSGNTSAKEYSVSIKKFWKEIEGVFGKSDFNENEKLCSLCTIKRLAGRVLAEKNSEDHILHTAFKEQDIYPSTTELAFFEYYKKHGKIDSEEKRKIAQSYHDNEEPPEGLTEYDKYYSILLMDGDKMGKLINGETFASSWSSIMHPDMVKRLKENDNFSKAYREAWDKIFSNTENNKKILTPATHAAISEALGDFALYGVKHIVEKHGGKLIYAGGDDVCAVMPTSTVLEAGEEISNYYTSYFNIIKEGRGTVIDSLTNWVPEPGKLSINLGKGENLSISAGILICHHKESLTAMIKRAHTLLDNRAKEQGGRNACAVELRKRSGGSRYFTAKWDEKNWEAFTNYDPVIPQSFVYKLESFRSGFEAILESDFPEKEKRITDLIEFELKRSIPGNNRIKDLVQNVKEIVFTENVENKSKIFNPESLIIASYLAKKGGTSK